MTRHFSRLDPGALHDTPRKPQKKSRLAEWILFGVFGVLLVIGAIALYTHFSPAYSRVPNTVEEGLKQDRLNLLVIGVAGDRRLNAGNDLADAILLVSLRPSTKQAALISVPRDLYVDIGRFGVHRLNTAHDIGSKAGYPGEGPGLLIDTVKSITGQPIHGFVRIDFAAFQKLIDELGGVDIYVYRPFRDFLFNDEFKQGWQHMSGERALRYARYRYVHGAEGNNFARELRQQQVVTAVRDKIRKLNAQQAIRLVAGLGSVSRYTTTNLTTPQMISLYQRFHDIKPGDVRHVSLAPLTEIFMVTDPRDPGEAVRPRSGNFAEIRGLMANVFSDMRPLLTHDQIPLHDGQEPKPAAIAGDDTLRNQGTRQPSPVTHRRESHKK
jgi:LCP family protein required for cell wall assembly